MIDLEELGGLLAGLRASITIADEDGCIVFLNDLALAHYTDRGGDELIGTNLRDCHNPASQRELREMYARYRTGDLIPTFYHKEREDGTVQTIVHIPIDVDGRFRGVAELMWDEHRERVHQT